jgi:hypothetical protein
MDVTKNLEMMPPIAPINRDGSDLMQCLLRRAAATCRWHGGDNEQAELASK